MNDANEWEVVRSSLKFKKLRFVNGAVQLSWTWLDSLDESNVSRQCHTKDCDANVDHRSFG